jgi:hypothetical protein
MMNGEYGYYGANLVTKSQNTEGGKKKKKD